MMKLVNPWKEAVRPDGSMGREKDRAVVGE
jgi:hypothetical protein